MANCICYVLAVYTRRTHTAAKGREVVTSSAKNNAAEHVHDDAHSFTVLKIG